MSELAVDKLIPYHSAFRATKSSVPEGLMAQMPLLRPRALFRPEAEKKNHDICPKWQSHHLAINAPRRLEYFPRSRGSYEAGSGWSRDVLNSRTAEDKRDRL